MANNDYCLYTISFFIGVGMFNAKELADNLINRAMNLQEFLVFRDMGEIVFDGNPIPYNINHSMGGPVEITVPAMTQEEAEQRVNKWLSGQRDSTC
jgi:hypothetical protein